MPETQAREVDAKMILLGVAFVVVPLWLAWGLVGTKFSETENMIAYGTESTATVKS